MLNHISAVIKQAITTFTCKSEVFSSNLHTLKCLLDKTTATDINLNPDFLTETLWKIKDKAPVTYMKIYEDHAVSVGVFILSPGMKLPLHDHPEMYGLIKVLAGTVRLKSFSVQYSELDQFELGHSLYPPIITAECTGKELVNSASSCCTLEPTKSNLHEIESVDGPAAFLDILSPPYETDIPNKGPRKCSYFKVLNQLSPKTCILEETPSPSWYWTDVSPYAGPELLLWFYLNVIDFYCCDYSRLFIQGVCKVLLLVLIFF